jgi:hypothetical protein
MEQYLNKIYKNLKNINKSLNILRFFSWLFSLLLIFSFFTEVKNKSIICIILIVFSTVSILLRIKEEKEKQKIIVRIVKILEEDIQFWEKQKFEYIELKKEITKKRKEKSSLLIKKKENNWLSKKIFLIKRDIQEKKSWIEKFKNC